MPRYVALLRAINVSGSRIIKMEQLREYFAMPGFSNIVSYIQSGNVLFDTKETDQEKLELKIEKKLLKELGFEVEVILRSVDEIKKIIKKDPLAKERKETDKYYVVFLKSIPEKDAVKQLEQLSSDAEQFKVIGADLHWLLHPDVGNSIVKSKFFEKKLNVLTTSRNWNTVNKISDL